MPLNFCAEIDVETSINNTNAKELIVVNFFMFDFFDYVLNLVLLNLISENILLKNSWFLIVHWL